MSNSKIDIVIPWVDGSDPEWLAEKRKYDDKKDSFDDGSKSSYRFRDWGLMRYWFRGVEKYMPWINKIYFITWGHVPEWLDTNHEKIVIVNHKDYIPEKYLPTFSSNVIELNIHHIKDLSDNFILFNDDMFVIAPTKEEMFFKNDLPCDMLLSEIMFNYDITNVFRHSIFNNVGIINKHFGNHKKKLKLLPKWVNPRYGLKNMLTNLNKFFFKRIVGFKDQHLVLPYNKNTFRTVWESEYENLDRVCMNKFRSPFDLTDWLCRYWRFMTGEFNPINTNKIGEYFNLTEDQADLICRKIKDQKKPVIVINDAPSAGDENTFNNMQMKIINAFETIFPDKCSFEK